MIDFSKLAQVTDSFHKESSTIKSKIKDSAKRRFTIRKAIKDNEDKTIEQLQAILASNGYEVSAEELEVARQQFENDKIRDNEDANHQEASEGAPGNDVKHTTPSNDKEVEKPAGAGQSGGDSPIPDSLKKKVADALGETDSTEAAIKAALECINPDEGATAEAVLSAVTEVLSGTIDTLESQLPSVEEGSEENNPEVLGDSAKKEKLKDSKKVVASTFFELINKLHQRSTSIFKFFVDSYCEHANNSYLLNAFKEYLIDTYELDSTEDSFVDFLKSNSLSAHEVFGDLEDFLKDHNLLHDFIKEYMESIGADEVSDAKKKLSDSKKASMKKRIKDAMEETTTTEDAIEAAVSNIDPEATPEDVCETVIEIMSEIINELQSENDNGTSEEKPAAE